jgi:hypothetical protein
MSLPLFGLGALAAVGVGAGVSANALVETNKLIAPAMNPNPEARHGLLMMANHRQIAGQGKAVAVSTAGVIQPSVRGDF